MSGIPPSRKGCVPWNKGLKSTLLWDARTGKVFGPEVRKRMSDAHIGKPSPKKGIATGKPAWNKGMRTSDSPKTEKWAVDNARRHKFRMAAKGRHSELDWEELKRTFDGMCLCCKRKEPETRLTKDHIVPLSMGGSDRIDNVQPLCLSCNAKKNKSVIDYRITTGDAEKFSGDCE